jgi:hypothetical protein
MRDIYQKYHFRFFYLSLLNKTLYAVEQQGLLNMRFFKIAIYALWINTNLPVSIPVFYSIPH